ncbi:MAG: molybdopterin guanine dinucleotide-containing S/N-oxide reductase [Desulfovibrionaceae bacterium]|nr:molybdopterin guanine dinucleotide-containing S/N-oxide reductase [Desulfovibrionaceae bacterium]
MGYTAAAGVAASLFGPSMLGTAQAAAPATNAGSCATFWGICKLQAKNGQVVKAEPFAHDSSVNEMTTNMPGFVHSPARIKYPMVRKGFLKDGYKSDTSERGKGEFVRVSWDKAAELIADNLKRVIKTYGQDAVYATPSGWYNLGKVHAAGACTSRLSNLMGGFVRAMGDYSTGATQVIMPHVLGNMEVYSRQTSWPVILDNSKVVVFWGGNPMNTLRISWPAPTHKGIEYLKELKKRGTRLIFIDPTRSESVQELGGEWIAPKPNTDVAMMLGVAYTIQEKGLTDQTFLEDYTTGFDKFLPYLMGKSDGQPKTPEWAESVCGVPAKTIRDLADTIAKNRSMLFSGWGIQRADHGEQPHWMLVTLACMLGQIGLPGGGFSIGHMYSNQGTPFADAPSVPGMSGGKTPSTAPAPIPTARNIDMLLNPGKTIDYNGRKVTYPDIKMLYNGFSNSHTRQPQRESAVRAWKKPECIVVHEMFWTPTARMADIVLPISTMAECADITTSEDGRFIIPLKPCIEPQYESKPTYDAFAFVADKLGIGDKYTEGKTGEQWLESFYNQAVADGKRKGIGMPSFKEFWDKGKALEFKVPEKSQSWVRYSDYREDPLLEPLGTPSGKIEIYSKTIEKMGYDDCKAYPSWIEPAEWLGSEKAKAYPLHMLTSHPRHRLHSQNNHVQALRKLYTVKDREPIWISTEDAKARGIKDGDVVRVYNERGSVLAGAMVTDNIRSGVVRLCEGGWYDPVEPGNPKSLCAYGSANVLTLDIGSSKLAQAVVGNTSLVQIEKYTGKLPAVSVFEAPKSAQ